jgi:hypothetical protein
VDDAADLLAGNVKGSQFRIGDDSQNVPGVVFGSA